MLTTPEVVRSAAARFGTREGLIDGDRRWSFVDIARDVEACARSFIALGLAHGDRVAVWAPNSAEWIFAALGAQMAGGVLVPINTRFKAAEAAYVINRSGARFLITHNGFLGVDYLGDLARCDDDCPTLAHRVDISGGSTSHDSPDAMSWHGFIATGAHVGDDELRTRESSVRPDDLCDIIFTSGTTGRPKGVMSLHQQNVRVFLEWSATFGVTDTDRYLIANPMFHTFGYKAGFLACLLRGATMLPVPVFDVDRVLEIVQRERVTTIPGAPTIYISILNHPRRHEFDLTSLRLAATGAAVVPVELINRLRHEMTFETIVTGYGLTESTGVISLCRPSDDAETVARTSGRAIEGVEVRVIDEKGAELPRGAAGEIICRGYNVMPGYFDDPEATAATIDPDGWLHTGDVGTMDDRGYLAITDRIKDMFIVGGFNAYPAEIENVLMGHPAVAQAAVVGRPDDRMGEVGHAFVVCRTNTDVDTDSETLPDELIAWCRERMANYKVPRGVTVVDALPLNASGKVLKFELRRLL